MKFTILLLLTTVSALVAAAPVHASSPLLLSTPLAPGSGSGSGQMADNMLPNNDLPGGGIGSSKRALANAVPDKLDSSAYYDPAAEKEAEEVALALDAASDNVAEDEGAVDPVKAKVKRQQGMGIKGDVNSCRKKFTPAKCAKCQTDWEMYQSCVCEHRGGSMDVCVQGKRQNYDVCAKKECP